MPFFLKDPVKAEIEIPIAFSLWLEGHCNQYLPKWLNNGCNNHLTLHQKPTVKVCGIKDICPECLGEEHEAIFCEKKLDGMASHNFNMRFLYVQAIHLSGCPHKDTTTYLPPKFT